MLKFYLTTVIIWMIIIYCVVAIFQNKIAKKLETLETKEETKEEKKANLFKKLKVLFMLAAIPVIRLLIVVILIYIATCKQEDFDKLIEKANKD